MSIILYLLFAYRTMVSSVWFDTFTSIAISYTCQCKYRPRDCIVYQMLTKTHQTFNINNNRLSVTSDYDRICEWAMLLGSSRSCSQNVKRWQDMNIWSCRKKAFLKKENNGQPLITISRLQNPITTSCELVSTNQHIVYCYQYVQYPKPNTRWLISFIFISIYFHFQMW